VKDILLNIRRALRLARVINFNPGLDCGPICLDIAVTSRCNHRCIFCGAHSCLKEDISAPEEMPHPMLEGLLEDCADLGVMEVVFSGDGEPLLYKGLPEIICRFSASMEIRLLSNGSTLGLMDQALFSAIGKLTISMNSIRPETHQLIHGYRGEEQFSHIKGHIERLLNLPGARRKLQINYVVCKDNLAEFPALLELARRWNVYFAIRPLACGFAALESRALGLQDLEGIRDVISRFKRQPVSTQMRATLDQAERACGISENRIRDSDILRPCYFGFYWGNVWSNGAYSQCTYCGNKTLGNLRERRFKDMWRDPGIQDRLYAAARLAETGMPVYPECKGCLGPQMQSAAFHRQFRRIPLQSWLLRHRAARYAR